MIILFTAGQLGNQIFQYSFVETVKDCNEKIVTSDCDYFNIFQHNKRNYIFVNKYIRFTLIRILRILTKFRIVTSIKQNKDYINGYQVNIDSYSYKRGLFFFIKVVEGFFQSKRFISLTPKIQDIYVKEAENYLYDIPKECKKVFVHIRRGDYLQWSVLGKNNPSLPVSYYKKAIDWFINNYENPYFIFLSNDVDYVEEEFHYIKNKKVSKNSVGVDIAIMKVCKNAIVSNSTLSWWGVYCMNEKEKVFGPTYWLGWQSNIWYPIGIELDFIKYLKVKD